MKRAEHHADQAPPIWPAPEGGQPTAGTEKQGPSHRGTAKAATDQPG